MATEAQIAANRRNAQNSTGPTSTDGKSRSSRNAVQHGLMSANPQLPGEDPAAFEAFLHAVIADQKPRGAVQYAVVERIAHLQWKLKRLPQIESQVINRIADAETARRNPPTYSRKKPDPVPGPGAAEAMASDLRSNHFLGKLQIYEQRLERSLRACLKELRDLRKDDVDDDEQVDVGTALADGGAEDGPPRRTLQEGESASDPAAVTSEIELNKRTQFDGPSEPLVHAADEISPRRHEGHEAQLVIERSNTNGTT
ncbi:hypothetical protein BH10PLA1_BH10PLA1_16920 [soil metagenome]